MSVEVKTNVIKRNGEEVHFNSQKIVNAVHKANEEVDRLHQMNDYQRWYVNPIQQIMEFYHCLIISTKRSTRKIPIRTR